MKFHLVDKVESIQPGKRIVTIKALSLAEEYLADHFPAFPVLPGVMMLEAMVQAAAWLVRVQQNFSNSIVVLQAARNIRYANFVAPGDVMRCEVDVLELGENLAKFKGAAFVGDKPTISGRIELRSFNLAQKQPYLAEADTAIVAQLHQRWKLVHGPEALAAAN